MQMFLKICVLASSLYLWRSVLRNSPCRARGQLTSRHCKTFSQACYHHFTTSDGSMMCGLCALMGSSAQMPSSAHCELESALVIWIGTLARVACRTHMPCIPSIPHSGRIVRCLQESAVAVVVMQDDETVQSPQQCTFNLVVRPISRNTDDAHGRAYVQHIMLTIWLAHRLRLHQIMNHVGLLHVCAHCFLETLPSHLGYYW